MNKSKAQRFAQKRNTAGGTLKGVIINLERNIAPYTHSSESTRIHDAISQLKILQKDWSDNYEKAKDEHV